MKLIKSKKEVDIKIKEIYRLKNKLYNLDSYIYEYSEDFLKEFVKFYSINKKSMFFIKNYIKKENIAILNYIEINENVRKMGIGKLFLSHFINEMKKKEVSTILLIADVKRDQKIGFSLLNWYQRMGFSIIYDDKKFPVLGLKQNIKNYDKNLNIKNVKEIINKKIEIYCNDRTIK